MNHSVTDRMEAAPKGWFATGMKITLALLVLASALIGMGFFGLFFLRGFLVGIF